MKLKYLFNTQQIQFFRRISTSENKYFITTPIFYVNGDPHLGHLHTLLVADVLHRLNILLGKQKTLFSAGTDEHGMKIQKTAASSGLDCLKFCSDNSNKFRNICHLFNISNNDFVRTTEERHINAVKNFWDNLNKKKFIYKTKYGGWYSLVDECFISSSQIELKEENGKEIRLSLESGQPLEWFEEENYMFKLTQFIEPLKSWIYSKDVSIKPEKYHQLVKHILSQEFDDLSISRPKTRISWGIEVPNDDKQTIYVWLDALINYLTVSGYPNELTHWPPTCHVLGKDIIKFHCVYWPAFLMAIGLPLPCSFVCHSHWTVEDLKMSKSRGNVIDPIRLIKPYSVEGLRYFLLRQAVPHLDGNFSELQMRRYLNAELSDTLGNLLNRCSSYAINKEQCYPALPNKNLIKDNLAQVIDYLQDLRHICKNCFEEAHFHNGLEKIMFTLRETNKMIEIAKPWKLAKEAKFKEELDAVIFVSFESLRISAILMQPIIPRISSLILDKLSIPTDKRKWENALPYSYNEYLPRKLNPQKLIVFNKLPD